jgi:hypothetical protein
MEPQPGAELIGGQFRGHFSHAAPGTVVANVFGTRMAAPNRAEMTNVGLLVARLPGF